MFQNNTIYMEQVGQKSNDLNTSSIFWTRIWNSYRSFVLRWRYKHATLDIVESWNGSSWTEVADINKQKKWWWCLEQLQRLFAYGGNADPTGTKVMYEWNGSSWTETSCDINTRRYFILGNSNSSNAVAGGIILIIDVTSENNIMDQHGQKQQILTQLETP